jgi:hypothetical protein
VRVITKTGEEFYHATTQENFDKILKSGRVKSLAHVGKETPDRLVSVEPNRWNRKREQMAAAEAAQALKAQGKKPDQIFLTRNGHVPCYGDYLVRKRLKSPVRSSLANLVPKEHMTRRALSVRSNATLIVPDDEVGDFTKKYPGLKFVGHGDAEVPQLSRLQAVPELPGRVVRSLTKTGAELKATDISRRAALVGSAALGTGVEGVSDYDFMVPYANAGTMMNAKQRYLKKYPGMVESPYNGTRDRRQTLSGHIGDSEVDITLAHGERAKQYLTSIRAAANKLSEKDRAGIRAKKKALKESWILPEYRYHRYKRKLDRKLGIERM